MSKFVFGIDLGTTYSAISYVDQSGVPVIVNNMEGTNTTPSVVNFAGPGSVVVGQVAKDNAVIDPKNTVSLVKTLMGKTDFAINYNGENKSPEEVSSYILRKVAGDAARLTNEEVKDVVITCPAYFGSVERIATKNAGIMAGLNVLNIISEPTAAALYYGCTKCSEPKTVMVYDLGGGTFDVTIMAIGADGSIEVVASDGNHELGGQNWDTEIMNYLASKFCEATGFTGDFDEYAQQDLRLKAEKAKIQLTSRESVPVMIEAGGQRARIMLDRKTFDELTQALLNESLEKTDAAIAAAEKKGYTVDEILFVGGSTRMPQVTRAVTEKYGMEPRILDPDEAVAKGAAIYALGEYTAMVKQWKDELGDTSEKPEKPSVPIGLIPALGKHIMDGTSILKLAATKSYALKARVEGTMKCCNMIIKNEVMEDNTVSVSRRFGTADDNQKDAELVVYESDFVDEYYDVDDDYILGTAVLDLPGNLPAGAPIQVTFTLNSDGILEVTGLDVTNDHEIKATMQAASPTTIDEDKAKEMGKKLTREIVVV